MMRFNGVHAGSFGHTKVVGLRDKLYTDFERKELTYRGLVLAAIEVPTVRKIEADFLVRGRNKQELFEKFERISDWLDSAGTAKLIIDSAPHRYYNARCTSVSTPEYSGLSMRFRAAFTCEDHRIYSLRTGEPLNSTQEDLSNFTFDGKHCLNDMNCVFVEDGRDLTPSVRANKYQIGGLDGSIRYSTGRPVLDEKTYTGQLYLVDSSSNSGLMDESDIAAKIRSISAWLVNAERSTLVMDSDTGLEWQAEVISASPFDRKGWENGIIKVKFILQPIAKEKTAKSHKATLSLNGSDYSTISLTDVVPFGVGFETPLVLSVKNNGASTVTDLYLRYYNHKNELRTTRLNDSGFSLPPASTLIIDGDKQSIMMGATSGFKWLKTGEFPIMAHGGTKAVLVKTSNAATLEVTTSFNVRWLG